MARQLTEAYGWQRTPRYNVRDRGLRVGRCRRPAASRNGHTGSADCTHLSLQKDAPVPGAVQAAGGSLARAALGGLHHQYLEREFPTGTAPAFYLELIDP